MSDDDLRKRLLDVPVPTLSAALYTAGVTNAFLVGLAPLDPAACRFAGKAFTLRALPVRGDGQDNLHREAIREVRAGEAIVTDTGGEARISFFGELIATHLKGRGLEAIVTDAGIADTHDVAATGLPVFCAGSAPVPGPARMVIAQYQAPIACRGVAVYPGDWLVGDANGVVVVPAALAAKIAEAAHEKERLERFLLEKLRDGAPLEGTYPPDAAMLEAFKKSASP